MEDGNSTTRNQKRKSRPAATAASAGPLCVHGSGGKQVNRFRWVQWLSVQAGQAKPRFLFFSGERSRHDLRKEKTWRGWQELVDKGGGRGEGVVLVVLVVRGLCSCSVVSVYSVMPKYLVPAIRQSRPRPSWSSVSCSLLYLLSCL